MHQQDSPSGDPASIQIGDTIPQLTRTLGLANWNRFAAVNYEFVPIHMDDEAGRNAGYDGAFGMGNLQMSLLHIVLRNFVGDRGRIDSVSCQFRGANLKGQTVTASGRVTARTMVGTDLQLDLDVWTEADGATRLAVGAARVTIPTA